MDIEVHKKCYLHFKCTHSRLTFTTAESALVQCFPTLFLAAHQHCAYISLCQTRWFVVCDVIAAPFLRYC